MAIPERSEVDVQYTWDAESIFATPEDWEAAYEALPAALDALDAYRGKLGQDTLLDWFKASEAAQKAVQDINQYAFMFSTVDATCQPAAARTSRATNLYSRYLAAVSFAEPEILKIGMETLNAWMDASPELAVYRHSLEQLEKTREHVRSPEVQKLMGEVMACFGAPSNTHSLLSNAEIPFRHAVDSSGESHEVIQPTIGGLLSSPDRSLRQSAWESYADGYLAFKQSIAACFDSGVRQNVFVAKAFNYSSAVDHAMDSFRMPTEVIHTTLAAYRANLGTWHRYYALLKEILGVDSLKPWDIKAPIGSDAPVVPYSQAIDWICEAMAPLGSEYVDPMRKGLVEDRWVDVYPNRGKGMGAFSSGHQGTRPFIFMSYDDRLTGMSTLAHELGHSMHSYLAWQHQPAVYAGCGSEVPSNFNQAMTRALLLDRYADPSFQIAVIEEALANFHRYFLIMPVIAAFELEAHSRVEQGQALTADSLNTLMFDLLSEAYGPAMDLSDCKDRLGVMWAQFPTHIYGCIFMFLYTVGIAGAHALSSPILQGDQAAAQRYLEYLKGGASRTELDGLKHAGVDITGPEPINSAFGVLNGLIDRLEAACKL
jgi:oligoendopeptidase F